MYFFRNTRTNTICYYVVMFILIFCFIIYSYNCNTFNEEIHMNAWEQVVLLIAFAIFSLGCLYFFPSIIVASIQLGLFSSNLRMVKEILMIVITYIINILFLGSFCLIISNNNYLKCLLGFYSLIDSNVLGLMQLMVGVIFNTTLLGLLVSVYQKRMTDENKDDTNVRFTKENDEYILRYKLIEVIKKK